MAPSGCSSLDGCRSGSGGKGSTVSVQLLASNPYYVCWASGGAHNAAGGLAAVVVAVVIVAFPLSFLWAVWSWARYLRACNAATVSGDHSDRHALVTLVNPMRQSEDSRHPVSVRNDALAAANGAEDCPPPLSPFMSDYRPERWYTRHADLLLSLVLAALQVCPGGSTGGSALQQYRSISRHLPRPSCLRLRLRLRWSARPRL